MSTSTINISYWSTVCKYSFSTIISKTSDGSILVMGQTIGVGRIFSGGALFLTKNLVTFFSHHRLLHGHVSLISTSTPHQSPRFFSSFSQKLPTKIFFRRPAGVHLTKITPFFPHSIKKCLEKFVFVALGCTCIPSGHAYGSNQ